MIYSFIFYYVIGAFIYFCHASKITTIIAERLSSQMKLTEEKKERLCINYMARILFQTVMMAIFPVSFGFYITISNSFKDLLVVSSGLFTIIWLIITGILIKAVYYFITNKMKSIKDCNYDKYYNNKEFFWIMCPILHGILFSLYDNTMFFIIFAIVLGKYLWMDSFRVILLSDIKMKAVGFYKKFKSDILLLLCQAFVMSYLLLRWYPVKDEIIQGTHIIYTLLLGLLFLMPIIDLLIFDSMKSYSEFISK